ncbi:hypothetical protein OIE66_06590 [Nonomuraea sp. NBC_01738]|uniref:hypothetical protein n=1 Tax=Nonomuraea sp. NBC_01738 TaxID=2976003 RepID=UPI002E15F9BB|nr:hypothetical protein OIE66_06590 [Nonomuraea sp. NBC_01738]
MLSHFAVETAAGAFPAGHIAYFTGSAGKKRWHLGRVCDGCPRAGRFVAGGRPFGLSHMAHRLRVVVGSGHGVRSR